MAHYLSADDLLRIESASRAMLSPLSSESIDDWRRDVNEAVRDLLNADRMIFLLPGGTRLFYCEEDPDLAAGVERYITAYSADGISLSDAVVDFWQRLRKQEGMEVFSWAGNAQMIGPFGYTMRDSEMVSELLEAAGVRDFVGMQPPMSRGDAMVWALFDRTDRVRFGEATPALLSALLPSLKAGLYALEHIEAQRRSFDALAEAIIAFDSDRREVFRNQAFLDVCATDPQAEEVLAEARRMAFALHPLVFPALNRRGEAAFAPGFRTVKTRSGAYELRGTLLPAGTLSSDPAVMITVTSQSAAGLPAPEVLRERYGLTAREAEVALLLAEGCSNNDIAERLFLSPHTARRHTANIFDKLGVNTRKALALKFIQE